MKQSHSVPRMRLVEQIAWFLIDFRKRNFYIRFNEKKNL